MVSKKIREGARKCLAYDRTVFIFIEFRYLIIIFFYFSNKSFKVLRLTCDVEVYQCLKLKSALELGQFVNGLAARRKMCDGGGFNVSFNDFLGPKNQMMIFLII